MNELISFTWTSKSPVHAHQWNRDSKIEGLHGQRVQIKGKCFCSGVYGCHHLVPSLLTLVIHTSLSSCNQICEGDYLIEGEKSLVDGEVSFIHIKKEIFESCFTRTTLIENNNV